MTGTIETTNNNIIIKINNIEHLLAIFKQHNIKIHQQHIDNFIELKDEYEMGSINILSDYFLIVDNYKNLDNVDKSELLQKKDSYFYKYQSFISKENFISKLDRILSNIKRHISSSDLGNAIDKTVLQDIYTSIKLYNNSTIDKNVTEAAYEMCICSAKMDIDSLTSALVCKECGSTKDLYGTVFEDEQFYFQEGQRAKHGTYDPAKHCRFWVERIQARETTEIPEKVINDLKKAITYDKIKNKKYISCTQIRKYLSQTRYSKYNEHVPLIRKLITGIAPDQLTDYEMQLVHIYFDKVIHIFDEIKPVSKTNCPYHPYFIYKIIEQLITKPHDRIRKLKILSCIHLQSRETLIENDRIWKLICVRIDGFVYIPTDRNEQYTEF